MKLVRTIEQKLLNLSAYPNYREVLIESADTKIALSLYESAQDDPCVVFLPGTMTHPLFYDDFLTLLAGSGVNVIGVHYISHGKSPRERNLYTFDDMIRNVHDTVSYCIATYHDNPILLGSSQGGILSMAAAGSDTRIKAVFPHNILLTELKETIAVTRFPEYLKVFYAPASSVMRIGARLFPKLQIPIAAYLDQKRVFVRQETKEQFNTDPIGLTKYPLFFMESLFSADLKSLTDGSITCPVVVIASTREALFPYYYTCQVYELLKAPKKEMLTFDEPYHLLFNECIDKVIDPISTKIKEYGSGN